MNKRSLARQSLLRSTAETIISGIGFTLGEDGSWSYGQTTATFESRQDKYGAYLHSLVLTSGSTTKSLVIEYPTFSASVKKFIRHPYSDVQKRETNIDIIPTIKKQRKRCAECGEIKDDIDLTISDDLVAREICVPCLEKSRS